MLAVVTSVYGYKHRIFCTRLKCHNFRPFVRLRPQYTTHYKTQTRNLGTDSERNNTDGLLALIRIDVKMMAEKLRISVQEAQKEAEKYIASIRKDVNKQLSAFSKISSVELQEQPFERTPTQKIKRFLYTKRRQGKDRKDGKE